MPPSNIWDAFQSQQAVSTDTRKIPQGAIFFALKGDNFDGNRFAAAALDAGAAFVVVDDPSVAPAGDDRYIVVQNSLLALQDLARQYRKTFDIPVIGITGSNGKTTTKELVQAVLSSERRAYATTGNLNNHIGVPLTLLAMPRDTEIAVIEMGANKPKDIQELVEIALPTHGMITNIGNAHLEGMGGIDGVQRTKGEMFDFLRASHGYAFVNENDPRVLAAAQGIAGRLGYGAPTSAYHIIHSKESNDGQQITVGANGKEITVTTHLLGRHNAENVLLAVAVGQHFGISDAAISNALAAYLPRMNRSQLHRQVGRTYLLDAYNANPSSMEATILSIAAQGHPHVALILGDMFELGIHSDAQHQGIWAIARAALPSAIVVGIGPAFHQHRPTNDRLTRSYASVEDALPTILSDIQDCEFVLLKGSRGMALERLLPALGVQL